MSNKEIAMQLTLKAIECGYISKASDVAAKTMRELSSDKNSFNAEEIAKFYEKILSVVDKPEEFAVQT